MSKLCGALALVVMSVGLWLCAASPSSAATTPWQPQKLPAGTGNVVGISCVGAKDCLAVAGPQSVLATDNGGKQWTRRTTGVVSGPLALWCMSASTCIAAGMTPAELLRTTDAGRHWGAEKSPRAADTFHGLACVGASVCEAVGSNGTGAAVAYSSDGGKRWSAGKVPSSDGLNSVSCPSPTHCVAVGYTGPAAKAVPEVVVTTDGGKSWAARSVPKLSGSLLSVSCPTKKDCWAVGYKGVLPTTTALVLTSTNGGSSWAAEKTPSGLTLLSVVSCPVAVTECWAGGFGVLPSAAGYLLHVAGPGRAWTLQARLTETEKSGGLIEALACTSAKDCWATGENTKAGGTGVMFATTDGG